MPPMQNLTVAGLFSHMGISGHKGIAVSTPGPHATQVDIAVTPPAWALLCDGTILTDELHTTHVPVPPGADTYALWLDYTDDRGAYVAQWEIASFAPSLSALDIAIITVAGGVIQTLSVQDEGLRNLTLQASLLTGAT